MKIKNLPGLSLNLQSYFKIIHDGWNSEYHSIDILLQHLSRRSKSISTRKNFLQHLHSFCRHYTLLPDELISLDKSDIEFLVQSFCDRYISMEYSRRTANNVLTVLRTFFAANGFSGFNKLQVEGYYTPKRYRKQPEYIPQKHEVYRMADVAGSLRNRAIILVTFSSGLRNSTILALRYKDIKEDLTKGHSNIKIPIYPGMKVVNPNACKNNLEYYSFICDEATETLRLYLVFKSKKYGPIKDENPLFSSDYNQLEKKSRPSKMLTSRQIQKIVKNSAKLAGIERWKEVTPHSLRKSFETVMRGEIIDGGHLDPKVQEFFMGHTLDGCQDNYFDNSKIEDNRFEYSKLRFGRVNIENKFQHLRRTIAREFQGSGIDVDKLLEEYVERIKKIGKMFN